MELKENKIDEECTGQMRNANVITVTNPEGRPRDRWKSIRIRAGVSGYQYDNKLTSPQRNRDPL